MLVSCQVLVPLLSFKDSELVQMRVGQLLDNVARLQDAHELLRGTGAIKALIRTLGTWHSAASPVSRRQKPGLTAVCLLLRPEDLCRKPRQPGGMGERACKAILGALR